MDVSLGMVLGILVESWPIWKIDKYNVDLGTFNASRDAVPGSFIFYSKRHRSYYIYAMIYIFSAVNFTDGFLNESKLRTILTSEALATTSLNCFGSSCALSPVFAVYFPTSISF